MRRQRLLDLSSRRYTLTVYRTCKALSNISSVYLFRSFPPECERRLHKRVHQHGNIPQQVATHVRALSLRFAMHSKVSSISILSVVQNVRHLRIGVPPCPPALPAFFRRLCAAISAFTHLSSVSFIYDDLPPVNTSSPNYFHNMLLAQLLTCRGHPLTSISLDSAHISASNLSLLRTCRSRLKVLKFADALSEQAIPVFALDRPWSFSHTLEALIVTGIPMKAVSALLHGLARGRLGALRRLTLGTSTRRHERGLDVPEHVAWAVPPLHATVLPFADAWFAVNVMRVVHTNALIFDFGPTRFRSSADFDFVRFLRDVPSLNTKKVVAPIDEREWTTVESLLHDKGILLVDPQEYW